MTAPITTPEQAAAALFRKLADAAERDGYASVAEEYRAAAAGFDPPDPAP